MNSESQQSSCHLALAVWFGFFGAFLAGAAFISLTHFAAERVLTAGMAFYGLGFFVYYPVVRRPAWLRVYLPVMALGAVAISARLFYVAARRPSAYHRWDDWALLAFLLAGMWSLVLTAWFARRKKG